MKNTMTITEKQSYYAENLVARGLISNNLKSLIITSKVSADLVEMMIEVASGILDSQDFESATRMMLVRSK